MTVATMSTRTWDAIVVGGGHNGLVAAAYLAKGGKRTLVLEKRAELGGAAGTSELAPGYRAPTLAHSVHRLRAEVVRDLGLLQQGLDLVEPEVAALVTAPDGPPMTLWADPRRTSDDLRKAAKASDADGWLELDGLVRRLASVLAALARETPPDPKAIGLSDASAGLRLLRAYRRLRRADREALLRLLPMAVADAVAEHLTDEGLAGAVAFRGVLYSTLGPMSAGTMAMLLADSGTGGGIAGRTVFARGGPGALTAALAAAARAAAVEIRSDAEVARVTSVDGRVTGVVLADGEEVAATSVVSAIHPKRLFLDLLDPVEVGPHLRWRVSNHRTTGSTAKVNLALGGLPNFRGLPDDDASAAPGPSPRLRGRIVLGGSVLDLEHASDDCRHGRIPARPPIEATIPSLTDPSLAPPGRHVLSAIVQYVPYRLDGSDWATTRDVLGDVAVRRLEEAAPGLGSLVEGRQVIVPTDLEREYGMVGGHALHGEASLDQWFAWRPLLEIARYRTPIAGLYLGGSGSHPGGGITGGPGANAARAVLADL